MNSHRVCTDLPIKKKGKKDNARGFFSKPAFALTLPALLPCLPRGVVFSSGPTFRIPIAPGVGWEFRWQRIAGVRSEGMKVGPVGVAA